MWIARAKLLAALADPLLPADDSPLLASEVMGYVERLGTVRAGLEGRIVLR